METNDYISSSEDEIDFMRFRPNDDFDLEETNEDSGAENISYGVRRDKIRVIVIDSDSDADTTEEEDNSEWEDVSESEVLPRRIQFNSGERATGPHVAATITEPVHFFKLFCTDSLVDNIVNETNNYARQNLLQKDISKNSVWKQWQEINRQEFSAFLAVILNMGTMPLANIQEYWSTDDNSRIPFFPNVFTRDRFMQIFWMLHLQFIHTIQGDCKDMRTRAEQVSVFLEYINSKFLEYFVPGENICVAESVVTLNGKISFITYNPSKPTKLGIRIYVLCDCETGYICGILPYYGSLTMEQLIRPDLPVTSRIPLHLYKMLLDNVSGAQGYHMFTAKCYTSLALAEALSIMLCHLTGTIETNQKGLPTGIKKPKFGTKKTVAYRKNNNLILAWKEKRVVTMFSNWNNAGMTAVKKFERSGIDVVIKKPSIVLNYTRFMGSVNRADKYAATYCFLRKSLKWWRKLFFWGMEICVINSYILYKLLKEQRNERPLSHLKYVKLLIKQLKGDFQQDRGCGSSSGAVDENFRLNGKLHMIVTGKKKDCKVCSNRAEKGGRRETVFMCDTCPDKPRLHLGECFLKYHTKINYKA